MCQNKERFSRKVEETFLYMIIKGSSKAAVILWKSPLGQMNQTVTWSPVSRDSTIESSSQLLPILYGSDMMSMVDGTTSAPSETVMVDSKTVPNPAYLEWKKKSLILLSWLHTTMRPTVFAQVIGYKTARSTWEALDMAYTSQTNARYYQIKHYPF